MKTLGLVGGLSAQVVENAVKVINGQAAKLDDPLPAAPLITKCTFAGEYQRLLREENWGAITELLVEEARGAGLAGADCIVICTPALNPVASDVRRAVGTALIDIGESVLHRVKHARDTAITAIAVIGTRSQREELMWRRGLSGLRVIPLDRQERAFIDECVGLAMSQQEMGIDHKLELQRTLAILKHRGAHGVIVADDALSFWIRDCGSSVLKPFYAATILSWTGALWAVASDTRSAPPCIYVDFPLKT